MNNAVLTKMMSFNQTVNLPLQHFGFNSQCIADGRNIHHYDKSYKNMTHNNGIFGISHLHLLPQLDVKGGELSEQNEQRVESNDSPLNLEYDSDDSVYDSTYQNINKQEHPLLRAAKLTKRIRKDKRITHEQRKALKARRNIITFRLK